MPDSQPRLRLEGDVARRVADRDLRVEGIDLVIAGVGAYKKPLAAWGERADLFPQLVVQLPKLTPPATGKDEAKAQKACAELRIKLWSDQLTSAATLQKAIRQLTTVIEPLPAAITRQRSEALLALLKQHHQFMGFPRE